MLDGLQQTQLFEAVIQVYASALSGLTPGSIKALFTESA